MVKSFNLNNFVVEYEGKDSSHEFVSFFNSPVLPDIEVQMDNNNAADVENEARKVFEDAYIQGEKAGHEMGMKKVGEELGVTGKLANVFTPLIV